MALFYTTDLIITSNANFITSFEIMDKEVYSDHCPIAVTCSTDVGSSITLVKKCSDGTFNDSHWDVNKRRIVPLDPTKINWEEAIVQLEQRGRDINQLINTNNISNDELNSLISTGIYDICKANYHKNPPVLAKHPLAINCTSRNFKAIAEINLFTYDIKIKNGIPFDLCKPYLQNWLEYERLALQSEYKELNLKQNSAFKNAKNDGRRMWELIDWKGKAESKNEALINDADVDSYFRNIFQSDKTYGHPVVRDVSDTLMTLETSIPLLDCIFRVEEFNAALKKIGKGCGLDGIPA